MTARASLRAALVDRLGSANEARWMVDEVLGAEAGAGATTAAERVLDDMAAERALDDMATRRLGGEPLQYVLGSWAFRTLELSVDARALIPRPETEQVVEVALAELRRQAGPGQAPGGALLVADLGTGTGAVALSIAAELGDRVAGLRVAATDVDPATLALAAANVRRVAERHPRVAGQVELRRGSWFAGLDPGWRSQVNLVVANPPYVSADEWKDLDPEVRREPYGALVADPGSDGTPGFGDVETVIAGAHAWLAPGGAVVVEMAPHHAEAALRAASQSGYRDVRVAPDLSGRPRALVGRR